VAAVPMISFHRKMWRVQSCGLLHCVHTCASALTRALQTTHSVSAFEVLCKFLPKSIPTEFLIYILGGVMRVFHDF
jgi:hypothetical protein